MGLMDQFESGLWRQRGKCLDPLDSTNLDYETRFVKGERNAMLLRDKRAFLMVSETLS